MKEQELVSIVIPAFNAEDFIEQTVESCLSQTYRPIEIVVVNDGSTDSTADIVRSMYGLASNKQVELRVIDVGQNQGAANALNIGFSSAKGSYICWLSADDVFIDRRKLQNQAACMKKTRALWSYYNDFYAGATSSSASLVRGSYLPHLRVLDPLFRGNSDLRLMVLLFRNPINGSSIMIRRGCIESFGQFDPIAKNVDADGDLWMRYSVLKLKLAGVKGAPVFYREHPTQTSKKKPLMLHGCELTRMRILLTLEKKGILTKLIRQFIPFFPIILRSKQHFERPFVSEFLLNYVSDHRGEFNRIFLRYICEALDSVKKHPNYLMLDKDRFSKDLALFMKSYEFKKFEEIFFNLAMRE